MMRHHRTGNLERALCPKQRVQCQEAHQNSLAGGHGKRRSGRTGFVAEAGFTLLELMVSFAILAFIVVIVAGAMRLGIHSVNSGEKKINSIDRVRTSLEIVDSQIESEAPLTFDDNGENKLYFDGQRDSMRFATNYSIWGGKNGYVVVNYKVQQDENGKDSLAVSENVIGIDQERDTTLFTGMDSIYFEYFYKGPTDENGSWVDTWTDDTIVPEKVKLHLVRGQEDFSLIIPMRTPRPLGLPGSSGIPNMTLPRNVNTPANPSTPWRW